MEILVAGSKLRVKSRWPHEWK